VISRILSTNFIYQTRLQNSSYHTHFIKLIYQIHLQNSSTKLILQNSSTKLILLNSSYQTCRPNLSTLLPNSSTKLKLPWKVKDQIIDLNQTHLQNLPTKLVYQTHLTKLVYQIHLTKIIYQFCIPNSSKIFCTPPRCQHAPTHCHRSRGRKEFHFQSQKAGGVRAGSGPSKEEC